jgi:hypothetical protein
MIHASLDWIWVIIFVVIALSQGWKKMAEQTGGDDDEPAPPRPPTKRPPRPLPVRPAAPPPLHKQPDIWRVGEEKVREYIETVRQAAAPPPIRQATPVPVAPPAPAPEPVKPAPTPPPVVTHRQPSRASIWATALRDKENLPNVILSAEIIGPPKGLN